MVYPERLRNIKRHPEVETLPATDGLRREAEQEMESNVLTLLYFTIKVSLIIYFLEVRYDEETHSRANSGRLGFVLG